MSTSNTSTSSSGWTTVSQKQKAKKTASKNTSTTISAAATPPRANTPTTSSGNWETVSPKQSSKSSSSKLNSTTTSPSGKASQVPKAMHGASTKPKPSTIEAPDTMLAKAKSLSKDERKTLLDGTVINLTVKTSDKDVILAERVPKAMFFTFVPTAKKFLVRNTPPGCTEVVRFPEASIGGVGARSVLNHLVSLCKSDNPCQAPPPPNLLTAIAIQRALKVFGLKSDARIFAVHLKKVFAGKALIVEQIKGIWEHFPSDCEWVHAMVNRVARHKAARTLDNVTAVKAYAEANPTLLERIEKPTTNDAAVFKKETPAEFDARKAKEVADGRRRFQKQQEFAEKKRKEENNKREQEARDAKLQEKFVQQPAVSHWQSFNH